MTTETFETDEYRCIGPAPTTYRIRQVHVIEGGCSGLQWQYWNLLSKSWTTLTRDGLRDETGVRNFAAKWLFECDPTEIEIVPNDGS